MRRNIARGLSLAALFAAQPVQAAIIPIIYNPGNVRVEHVAELPDEPAFKAPDGHLNLGWAYKDYSLYGMPLGYADADGFVLYNDQGYYHIKPGHMPLLNVRMGHDYAREYHFNPLGHLWGWPVVLMLVGLAGWRTHRRRARVTEAIVENGGYNAALAAIDRAAANRPAEGEIPVSAPIPVPALPARGLGRKGVVPNG